MPWCTCDAGGTIQGVSSLQGSNPATGTFTNETDPHAELCLMFWEFKFFIISSRRNWCSCFSISPICHGLSKTQMWCFPLLQILHFIPSLKTSLDLIQSHPYLSLVSSFNSQSSRWNLNHLVTSQRLFVCHALRLWHLIIICWGYKDKVPQTAG